jgi:hypothetical protein
MKTPLFLIALLTFGAVAAAPTAEAAPPAPDLDPCEHGGQYGVDIAVGRLCLSYYWPGCNAWVEWTAIPSQDTCLYRTDGLQSSSAGPDVQCMEVYSQTYLASGYWLVRRDTCSAQLYQCPEGYSPPSPPCQEASLLEASSASTASTAGCYMVYTRTDVGTYSVVRRTSCSPPEFYSCPYQGAPIDQCRGLLELSAATASAEIPWPGGQTPDVQCMDVYSQTQVPGTNYWIVRRNSCSVELYECPAGYSPPAPPCQHANLLSVSAAQPGVGLPPIYCMPYTREFEAGPLTVEQGGCGNDVELCDDSVLDREVKADCITDPLLTSSSAQEPMCMYYYYEYEVGPVRHVQRDSCHSETYVCDDDVRRVADPTQPQLDEAWLQMCLRDTLDDYIAWG